MGPNYGHVDDEDEGDELLFRAYRSAMLQARVKGAPTVAFSLLSAGIFRGWRPLAEVLKLGVLAVEANVYPALREVVFVGFTNAEVRKPLPLLEHRRVRASRRSEPRRPPLTRCRPAGGRDGRANPPFISRPTPRFRRRRRCRSWGRRSSTRCKARPRGRRRAACHAARSAPPR